MKTYTEITSRITELEDIVSVYLEVDAKKAPEGTTGDDILVEIDMLEDIRGWGTDDVMSENGVMAYFFENHQNETKKVADRVLAWMLS